MQGIKIFAGTNVGLRDNNEDNFTVCPDLQSGSWAVPTDHQQVLSLGNMGSLLLVADGMGGQNAGEVASAIAVQTVEALFSLEALSSICLDDDNQVRQYLLNGIEKADARIKAHAHDHAETSGMGSTLVMAWILKGVAHVAWIGDSRAYAVMPSKGIARLTKDHSFVQGLVDKGQITEEEAMTHPNSNIITRSLGDMSQRARGDVVSYSLHNGEVILLCSDGLCGVCSDAVIGGIVEDYVADLQQCKEQLTNAALRAGGSDNITIALAQYFDDGQATSDVQSAVAYKPLNVSEKTKKHHQRVGLINVLFCVFAFLILSALGYAGWHLFGNEGEKEVKIQSPRTKKTTDCSHGVDSTGGYQRSDTSQTRKEEKSENAQTQAKFQRLKEEFGGSSSENGTKVAEIKGEDNGDKKNGDKKNGGKPTLTEKKRDGCPIIQQAQDSN